MFSKKTNRNSRRSPKLSQSLLEGQESQVSRRHKPDYILLIVSVILLIVGLVIMYSISPGLAAADGTSQLYFVTKQIIAIGLGVIAFIVFSLLPISVIKRLKNTLIWLSLIMVIAVQLFGEKVNGAYRWVQVGDFSFQVAELLKLTIIVWVASFLVERLVKGEVKSTDKTLKPILILIGIIGLVVAVLESDLGSSGVMIIIIISMAFSAGMPIKKLALVASIIVIGAFLAIAATPYRRDRLTTFFNPAQDCQDRGYQSCQALIAIGSGGLFGLGLGNGVQAYGYLPEAENDSIFAILGEKFGFIGTTLVVSLYAILFARMRRIIICTRDTFSRLFVIGVVAWLSSQTIINIGAMVGLLPLKGITLPLISYGGTSTLFVMIAIGIVFQISRYTAYAPVRNVSISESEDNRGDNVGRRRQRRPYYPSTSNS